MKSYNNIDLQFGSESFQFGKTGNTKIYLPFKEFRTLAGTADLPKRDVLKRKSTIDSKKFWTLGGRNGRRLRIEIKIFQAGS